tara:strand:- start:171 stop:272 length:102 start_codon:yes stop_codon:yes gene_type:complete
MGGELIFAIAVPLVVLAYAMIEALRYERKKNNQ